MHARVYVCVYMYVRTNVYFKPPHLISYPYRLQLQISSLEKELGVRELVVSKTETQLQDVMSRHEAAPRQEVVERYREEVERMTQEIDTTRESLKE